MPRRNPLRGQEKELVEPWERQPGENAKQFAAFRLYRDMEPHARSYRAVAEKLSVSEQLIKRWGAPGEWVRRALTWDDEKDRVDRIQQKEERRKMVRRHIMQAQAAQVPLQAALKKLQDDPKVLALFVAKFLKSPYLLAKFHEVVMKSERLSFGETTENTRATEERGTAPAAGEGSVYDELDRIAGNPAALAAAQSLARALEADARGVRGAVQPPRGRKLEDGGAPAPPE